MAKQYKVLVNTGKQENNKTVDVQQFSGDKGQPVRIKAQAGAKYQLQEATRGKNVGPDYVKAKRVGKHLHILFEDETQASLIIEDYYSEMAPGYNGVIGEAENGRFYEYIPEDPRVPGLIPELAEGGQAVNVALGGVEIAPVGAVVAAAAFPLLGALGLLGAAGAAAYVANKDNATTTSTTTGRLDPAAPNDSGALGDNKTNDNTPTLSGTAPVGSNASVIVNGVPYPVTVAADGTWKFTQPNNLPDGTYYPILQVTQNGVTSSTNLTPFTIDTTPPTVAVTSNAAALGAGQTATITFTLSEPSTDFTADDITVTGGTLSGLTQSATDPKVYTATFTPTASSAPGTATIKVDSAKFNDAAANTNADGAEANNTVSLTTNATTYGALQQTAPNDSGVVGDNKTNDTTPTLTGKVPAGSTASVTINGVKYPVTTNPDGTWSFTNPTNLPDGTYTPVLEVTTNGQTSSTPLTPFTIDTTPPTIVVASNATTLAAGQTANLSFTLSEPASDFTADDITVTGGTLSNFQKSATDPKVYTATFTPTTTGTSATIKVDSTKFTDAAANVNADGADTSPATTNTVSLTTNTTASGQLSPTSDNSTGTPNDNKTNDKTPELSGKVPAGSTATVTINGQTYPVTTNPDGTWSFTQPTDLPDGTYTPQLNVTTNGQTTTSPLTPFTIDTTAPTVAISGATALAAGQSTTLTFTLSEASTDLTDADFAVAGGQLGPLQQSATDPKVYTATFTAGNTSGTTASVSIASDKFADAAGNLNKDGTDANNTWSTSLSPATTPNTNGVKTALTLDPIATDNVLLAAEAGATSYPVTGKVTGKYAPGDTVTLMVNGKSYAATVAADGTYRANIPMADIQADPDTKIEASVTGTNGDTATAAQDYTLESGNTATQTALSINAVTADNIVSAAENTGTVAITGNVTGKYAAGDTVTLTVNGKTFTGPAAANGSFSIGVPAADLIADADTQVDGTVKGTGGTTATALQNYGVDTSPTASAKTALSINPITGDNIITVADGNAASITVTGKVTGAYAAGDSVTLTLNGKNYVTTVAADGSYSTAIPMADFKGDLDTKIDGTVTGTGGDTATAAQDYQVETNANAGTLTALSIDPVTADNLLANSEATGNVAITGKVTGKYAAGDTVTLTVNGKTFTGQAAANGSYSINVPATDLKADADTQVDGTVTGTGGTAAAAMQNYAIDGQSAQGNKTALSINPVTGDNVLLASETGATTIAVTGKVTGAYAAGDIVSLSVNGKIYTAAIAADGSYTANIATADLKADADTQIDGTVTGTGGDTATAAQDYTLESGNTATQTSLSINPVTADNILSAAENTGNVAITGKVAGKYAAGDTVTLTVNGKTFTGQAAADGSYSINVPASDLAADSDTQVDGTVTGTGGTTAKALQDYALDSGTTPASASSAKTALAIDPITGDNIVTVGEGAATSYTVTGKVTGTFAAGDIVALTLNGHTYTATVATDGSFSVPVSMSDLKGDADTQIEGSVTGTGGDTATAAQDYVVETSANAGTQTALSINPVTADNMIGSGETTGNIAITGTVTGKYAAGDTVTLTVNGKPFTGTVAANGSYSIAVPAADLTADSDTQIDGTVTGTGGTTAKALQNYGVDSTIAPPVTPTGDTTPPTIIVERTNPSTATLDANGKETITFKLSEASTTFDQSDIAVTGGTLSNFTPVPTSGTAAAGYTQYTAVFTPTANSNGTATIGVASGKFADAAGNLNQDTYVNPAPTGATVESNNSVSLGFDTRSTNPTDNDKPTVQISADKTSLSAGQTATLSIILSEASSDFTAADIDVISGGGAISNLQPVAGSNGVQYTATYTAGSTAGTVVLGVDATKFTDAAGNANADTYKGSASGTTAVSGATAETNNWVSLTNTGANDTTAPTVAVTRAGSGTVGSTGETIVFTFSEGVATSSFTLADIDTTGGAVSALTPVESSKTATGVYTQYSATYTPTANSTGTGTVGVAAGKFADAAGNANLDTYSASADTVSGHAVEANNQVTLGYNTSTNPATPDTTAPKVAISADKTTLSAGQTATLSFTLSESSTDFTQSDITVTGGTLSNWQGSGTSYTATFTPTAGSQGTGSVHVASDTFRDAASNYNQDGADANNTVNFITNNGNNPATDTTAPTIAVERLGSGTLTSSETIQFTLSEASKDFTLADIAVTGGTLTNLAAVPTSGTAGTGYTTYVATFTPTAGTSGQATIGVASGKFSDAAGNTNLDTNVNPATAPAVYEANNQVAISYNTINPSPDTTAPTVAVARAGTSTLQSGGTDTVTFTLSEASLTFDSSDVTVTGGGALSNWTPVASSGSASTGYTVYTATYTPPTSGSGNVTIGVKASTFGDAAGNLNKDTFETGIAGTTVEANNQVTVAYNTSATDNVPPTVEVLRSATGTINGAETIYFNFSEATTDFALTDITASGGTMSNLVAVTGTGNKQYTATFTPTANSTTPAAIGVKAATFSDAAGILNKDTFDSADTVTGKVVETNNQVNANVDTTGASPIDETPPTVAISRVGTGAVTSVGDTIVFTFSEPVSGFALADIVDTSTGNAASGLSNLTAVTGSGNTQFTATYTAPTGSVGTVTLGVKAGTFSDAASPANANKDTYEASVAGTVQEANNQLTLGWNTDTTTPTIGISSSASTLSGSNTATITFTLSEASADFAQSMVDISGGSLTNWTKVDATHYTATFTPNANSSGTATIGVLGDKFKDLASNLNKDTYATSPASGQTTETSGASSNKVDISFDTRNGSFAVSNDSASVGEDGGTANATTGTALASTTSGVTALNVLNNDSGSSMSVTGVKLSSATSTTAVASGSTSASSFTSIAGQYGTLHIGADGSYTYAVDNSNATVQALKGSTNTLSEVFTYSASGTASGTAQTGNANLTITITGTNDAPVAVADTASATEAGGTANATAGTNPTGNVLTNDTDVDTADTKVVSAIHAGSTLGTSGDSVVAAGSATSKTGSFGSISINADGSYTYTVDPANATVQALLPNSTALTDTFTYTVKDAAGLTSQEVITVSVKGANDAPEVQVPLVNQTAAPDSLLTYQFAGNTGAATDTFKDVDTGHPTGLTYTATLADGSSLPSWLSFNATTRTFSGTPPESAASTTVAVKVTATDALNASTSDTFDITIGAVPTASALTALSINPIATDNVITSAENTGNITVTGKVTGKFASGNTVTLVVNGQNFTGNVDANGAYSIAVPAADLAADSDTKIEGSVTGTGGSLATAAQDYTVEASSTLTKTALAIDPVTADNLVGNTEPDANGDIAITGKVTGKFAANDVVTLVVNGAKYSGTAAADGTYSIKVKATDLALDADTTIDGTVTGTGGTLATALQNYGLDTTDTTKPTIAISSNQASLASGQTATITFTLSEPSTDFASGDVTTSGGNLSNWSHVGINSAGEDVYTATFTPTANSTSNGVISVASNKFTDVAGNANADGADANNTVTLTVNTSSNTTPTGVKTALSIDPVTGDNVVISTATGNVNITGKVSGTYAAGDTVTLTINNTAFTGTVAADGSYSIPVPVSDLSADSDTKVDGTVTGTGGDTATAAQDYTVETSSTLTKTALTIDRVTSDNVVLASEADANGKIAVTGKVDGKFANGDTVTLTINGNTASGTVNSLGIYSINVNATDLLADSDTTIDGSVTGTGGTTATATQNYALTDLTAPTIAISRAGTGSVTGAETITFKLSEASTTFTNADIDVSGGVLGTLATTDNITYTATFTPTSGFFGSGAIGVKAGTFTDAAGNANKDTYEAFVTGTVLEENNLLDLNINTDTTPPTVVVTHSTANGTTVTGAETITFTLSDNAGTSFDASDIFVTPGAGTLSNFVGDGTTYTATFTPTANSAGSVVIGVKAGKFSDPAGNLNKDTFDSADTVTGKVVEANNAVTFDYKTDNTTPTIAISGPSGAVSGPTTITFTLSEVSSDFVWDGTTGDIAVSSGTLSALTPSTTNPLVWTATYTPPTGAGTGTATISVASDKFTDAAGNFNKDGGDVNNSLSVSFDTVTPTVAVTRAGSATLGGTGSTAATETITFTLSEASTDFTSADVVVSAGALSNWTAVSSTVYTATYTPPTGANAAVGTATIGVKAGKFQDAAGNQNADDFALTGGANNNAENANNQVSVGYDTVAPTQTVSFSSMTKDSGLSSGNANWTTADASAGRLVSGFVSAPLATGETVQIWAKKDSGAAVLLGTATVDAGGTTWEYTDTTNYVGATGATSNAAGWTYSAKVVDAAGNAAPTTSQVVNGDYTEAAPVITGVTDSASASVGATGTNSSNLNPTTNTLASVSGTGVAGGTIYLYDNSTNNLVGTTTVAGNGTWSVTGLTGTYSGSNTFSAKQVDALGNQSVLSNLWTVTADSPSLFTNGDFSTGNTGFTSSGNYLSSGTSALTGGIYDNTTPDYNVSNSYLSFDTVAATNATASGTVSGINWTADYVTGSALTNPDGAMTGNVMFGGLVTTTAHQVIWSENVNVVAGQSYIFKFDYWDVAAHLEVSIGGVVIPFYQTTTLHEGGHFTAQFTAASSGPMTLAVQGNGNGAGTNLGNYALDNLVLTPTATPSNNTLTAGSTPPATPNNDTALTYTSGNIDALAGNDTITATSTTLQSTLAAGGSIDGGAGIDTLKLAAGTTLNLETLTGNQTVQKIQEVEIFQMQGTSNLTLSANNVLSLGGANASTMAPFTFSSTSQVADGATAATGSTSSTGKVQMVIQGSSTDALKLDALATDGVSSTGGVLGNSGLTGTWAYKGQVQIGTITYKVYDHSTTNAQVLVDVPVVVTTVSPIAITAISADSGTSATDFVTNDTTLTYSGTVPVEYNDANHDVFVEILNSSGTVVQSGTATISGSNWTLDKTASALTAGNYTIRSTIVNQGTTTATSSFGSQGVDTQALVIDTTVPTIAVARANNSTSTLTVGQTETINFTLSEASTDFDVNDITVSGGTLSNFNGSGTSYSVTFTPTANTSGTGSISVASAKFSDAAGNQNADGADANNTASVPYVTAPPSQTVAFSSMTKDSSRALDNADWTTADGSAGRLLSGTISAPLTTGQKVEVFSNGISLGFATVVGKAWEITDTTAYSANWTYTAKVVDAAGNGGTTTTQIVSTDFTEIAPVITAVVDAASASIANAGTTTNALSSVSGTGVAGNTIYLYDNTSTNLVGSTTVGSDGNWTVSGLSTVTASGSNTFAAKQVDPLGNQSVLSNLWSVTGGGTNLLPNGDFDSTSNYFTHVALTATPDYTETGYRVGAPNWPTTGTAQTLSRSVSATGTSSNNSAMSWTVDNFVQSGASTADVFKTASVLFGSDNIATGGVKGDRGQLYLWQVPANTVAVVAGKTYQFKLNYVTDQWATKPITALVDGVEVSVPSATSAGSTDGNFSVGTITVTYTAAVSKNISLAIIGDNTRATNQGVGGDYWLDDISFKELAIPANNTLVAGTTPPGTSSNDTALTYTAGSIDGLAGNDTITATSTGLQSVLAAGGFIDGGAGVDTLKLAAGTTLDLTAITGNQTVRQIQQVEAFDLQGNSSLTLSANDVLSLGGANASTMSAFAFSSTTGGSASASSTGKVQMVITGTSSDALKLKALATDGVTTNATVGNTGLGGEWLDMGTTTIGSTTFRVYNHSTTQAQVLTTVAASTESATVAFTTMTKDSGPLGANADWRTADGSAGRLVSGTLADPLPAGSVVKVYANGTLLGNATVNTAGTAWEYTDTAAYSANWTYRADVVNSSSVVTGSATQIVTTDFTEAAPVITGVVDAASTLIANAGTTTSALSSVSGTGNAGDTIYLYDNTSSNLVGTTTVGADGKWTVSSLVGTYTGSNTFSAKQVDVLGNESVLSNLYAVTTPFGTNKLTNGDFSTDSQTGFTTAVTWQDTVSWNNSYSNAAIEPNPALNTAATNWSQTGTTSNPDITWSDGVVSQNANPDGTMKGNVMTVNIASSTKTVFWQDATQKIEAGKTYIFKFDYAVNLGGNGGWLGVDVDGASMNVATSYESGHFTVKYVATSTKTITLALWGTNANNNNTYGDFNLDNLSFSEGTPAAGNTLVAGGTPPGTPNVDAIAYTGGTVDALASDDTITAGTDIQAKLAAGGFIDGGAGIDTLKLAASTTLNLVTLTNNQTVKSLQQIEAFELQGSSTLTLSANDVLSLGAKDAFSGTAGKVQLLIKGTSSDSVSLQNLLSDSAGGNTGLAGMWTKESSTVSVNSATYNVYTHSTTGAQVLISAAIPDANVSVSASPLVLDLNGDGVQTLGIGQGVQFDLMNTGTAQNVGWVDRHDGLLVMDLNHDGRINTGAELLGTSTRLADGSLARDGWQALAQYDANADGQINAQDAAFADLKVWVDANADGVTDSGELKSLADVGVQSIGLHHDGSQTQQNGNVLDGLATVQRTDGTTTTMTDAWLSTALATQPVLNLDAVAHANGVVDLSNGQAEVFKLSASDVLQLPTNTNGQHVLQVQGDSNDTVNLSKVLTDGQNQGEWSTTSTTTQNGHTFNVYQHSGDPTLQVLIDQHIAQVHVG